MKLNTALMSCSSRRNDTISDSISAAIIWIIFYMIIGIGAGDTDNDAHRVKLLVTKVKRLAGGD